MKKFFARGTLPTVKNGTFLTAFVESMGRHAATQLVESVLGSVASVVSNLASHHLLVSTGVKTDGNLQRDVAMRVYVWVSEVILSQSSPRTELISAGLRSDGGDQIVVAPGSYIFRYEGVWFYAHIKRTEKRTVDVQYSDYSIHITTFRANKDILNNAVRAFAPDVAPVSDTTQQIRELDLDQHRRPLGESVIVKRKTLEDVIVSDAHREQIRQRLHMWKHNAQWYYDNGFPHKVSFEFSGPPGTGKTLLAQAIAGEMRIPLITVNMQSITDDSFPYVMQYGLPEKCVVLFDDFDVSRVFHARKDDDGDSGLIITDKDGRTKEEVLAMILRTLSGPIPLNGKILVFTTNKHHKIDAAVLRKGRIDCHLEIGPLKDPEIKQFIRLHFPQKVDLDKYTFPSKTGADLTDILYQHPYDVDAFTNAIFE